MTVSSKLIDPRKLSDLDLLRRWENPLGLSERRDVEREMMARTKVRGPIEDAICATLVRVFLEKPARKKPTKKAA